AVLGVAPPLDRGRQRVERERKTFAGRVDGAWLGHVRRNPSIPVAGPNTRAIRAPQGDEICCTGKRLGGEAYVFWRLGVNVLEDFLRRPVHGADDAPRRSLTRGARMVEAVFSATT